MLFKIKVLIKKSKKRKKKTNNYLETEVPKVYFRLKEAGSLQKEKENSRCGNQLRTQS